MPRVLLSDRPPLVLVVDDSDAARYVLARALRKEGYSIEEAASGIDALRALAREPDLVVLDVRLPDLDGFEICRRIKENPLTARIPIVHVSAAFTTPEDQVTALTAGADAYLVQPVEPTLLVATTRALLRARRVTERLAALAGVAAAFRAGTVEEVAGGALDQLTGLLGATAGVVYVRDESGGGAVVAARGFAEEIMTRRRLLTPDAYTPLTDAARDGRLVLIASREEFAARYPLVESEKSTASRAWAAIPLRVDGAAIGAVGLTFAEPLRFDDEDRAFLLALGAPCAEAIERARLRAGR